jgi:uncharacterized membrane protein
MYCKNCGQQVADNATFCGNCGTQVGGAVNNNVPPQENNQYAQQNTQTAQSFTDKIFNTPDSSDSFTQEEAKDGKVMSVLCYLGILVLIPLFAEKNNRFVRYHVNQGFNLFLLEIAVSIVSAIFMYVPVFGTIIRSLLSLATLAYAIIGIVNVAEGKAKELPFIGKIKILNN